MKKLIINEMKEKTWNHLGVNETIKYLPYFDLRKNEEPEKTKNDVVKIDRFSNEENNESYDETYNEIQKLNVKKEDFEYVLRNETKEIVINKINFDNYINIRFVEGRNDLILKFEDVSLNTNLNDNNLNNNNNINKNIFGYLKNYLNITSEENTNNNIFIVFDHSTDKMIEYDKINIHAKNDSTINIVFAIFGKMEQYVFLESEPMENSIIEISGIYMLKNSDKLDIFSLDNHTGKNSNYEFDIYGVMDNESYKNCKMVIDFANGSTDSKGNEKEEVVLLSDEAKSKSSPILLCNEENVMGNHGATIGKISEDKIFYLQSRGFSYEDSKALSIIASFEKVFLKLKNFSDNFYTKVFNDLRYRIFKFLNVKFENFD